MWTTATEVSIFWVCLTLVKWTADTSYFCRGSVVTTVARVRTLPSQRESRRVDSALRPVLLAKYQAVVPFTLVAAARAQGQPSLASSMGTLLRSSVWIAGLPDIFLHVRLEPFLQQLGSMQPCCRVGCLGSTISISWLSFNVNSSPASSRWKSAQQL